MKNITLKVKKLDSLLAKMKGLMFESKMFPIYFETRFGIHTFFVKEPIDILLLGENNCVKILIQDIKPWRIVMWNPKYYRVLELPTGLIEKRGINNNSKIIFEVFD